MEIFQYFLVGAGVLIVIAFLRIVFGFTNYSSNSKEYLTNHARQYIAKIASYEAQQKLYPKVDYIVEDVMSYSEYCKEQGHAFYVGDELAYIECILEYCFHLSSEQEYSAYFQKNEKIMRCNNISKYLQENAWRKACEIFPIQINGD